MFNQIPKWLQINFLSVNQPMRLLYLLFLLTSPPVNLKCLSCLMYYQIWQAALSALNPNPTDNCPLYLNHATVAALPSRVSRHNSPSSAHFVSRLVRSCLPGGNNRCIVVCILRIAFDLACHKRIVLLGIFFTFFSLFWRDQKKLLAAVQICYLIV